MPRRTLRSAVLIRTLYVQVAQDVSATRGRGTSSRPHAESDPHRLGGPAVPLRLWLVILSFVVLAVMPFSALAQTSAVDRPAELLAGTCGSPGEGGAPLAN